MVKRFTAVRTKTRRAIIIAAVGAPLLFGGSYYVAGALTPDSASEQTVDNQMNIPTVAGLGCAEGESPASVAQMAGYTGEGRVATIDGATNVPDDVAADTGSADFQFSSCAQTTAREYARPFVEIGPLAA